MGSVTGPPDTTYILMQKYQYILALLPISVGRGKVEWMTQTHVA